MDYLKFAGKKYLVFGVANRKSIAYFIADIIRAAGGNPLFSVLNQEKKKAVEELFPDYPVYICNVSSEEEIERVSKLIKSDHDKIDGIVHSVAFADFSDGIKPFHETDKEKFLQALDISCFSLISISNAFKGVIDPKGTVVSISISSTNMAAENYGYMAPIKAALDSSVVFLAKSFSAFSEIRVNSVAPSLLKTSSSAGIPGYIDSYLYAERVTLRKKAVHTEEVANVAAFLLSDASSGINAQKVVVDAGMGVNYFDQTLINRVNRE